MLNETRTAILNYLGIVKSAGIGELARQVGVKECTVKMLAAQLSLEGLVVYHRHNEFVMLKEVSNVTAANLAMLSRCK